MHIVNGWLSNIHFFIPHSSNELSWYKFKIILMQVKCRCEQYVFISMFLFDDIFTLLTLYFYGIDFFSVINELSIKLVYVLIRHLDYHSFTSTINHKGDFRFYFLGFFINCCLYVSTAYQRNEHFECLQNFKLILFIKM